MARRVSQPGNEDEFELFCLRFLRHYWNLPHLKQFGKRGERQFGVDLIDPSGERPVRAVQCKHHEEHKTIPPAEIKAEVEKAEGFSTALEEFYILTSARKSAQAETAELELNVSRGAAGKFRVYVWAWTDIETRLAELDEITQDRVINGETGRSAPNLEAVLTTVIRDRLDLPLYSSESKLDGELDEAKAAADAHNPDVARFKIEQIEKRHWDKLSPMQRYRLRAQQANLLLDQGEWQAAGLKLLEAKQYIPAEERALVNEALGYELTGDSPKAHGLATTLRTTFPRSARLLAVWVRTAPETATLEELEEVALPLLGDNTELPLSLAQAALAREKYSEAKKFAEMARDREPDAPQCWLALAQATHETGHKHAAGAERRSLFAEAERLYGKAIDLAREQKLKETELAARLNRGTPHWTKSHRITPWRFPCSTGGWAKSSLWPKGRFRTVAVPFGASFTSTRTENSTA